MSDPDIILYHCPSACSQVAVCALEMTGLPFRLELINLFSGEHKSGDYAAINPMAKVPYMLIDGVGLAENVAILFYLGELRPESGIFPKHPSARTRADVISGMSFCSGTLHPIVRGMFNPARLTTGDTQGVRDMAMSLGQKAFAFAEERLGQSGWWLGEPTIVDVYLNWARSVAVKGGFDFSHLPHLAGLPGRLEQIPAFVAMMQQEAASDARLGL